MKLLRVAHMGSALMSTGSCLSINQPVSALNKYASPVDAVVMIHGAGGGPWEWEKWTPEFVGFGWNVIVPELKPHAAGLAATKFSDYQDQIAQSIPKDASGMVLIGASLGGALALSLAPILNPAAIILVNTVPLKGLGWQRGRPSSEIVHWANRPVEESQDAMPDCDEEAILDAAKRWRDESGIVLSTVAEGIDAAPPTCPVLVIAGQDDADIPVEVSQRLAKHLGARFKIYERMAHVGPLLGPRAGLVARESREWLVSEMDGVKAQ